MSELNAATNSLTLRRNWTVECSNGFPSPICTVSLRVLRSDSNDTNSM